MSNKDNWEMVGHLFENAVLEPRRRVVIDSLNSMSDLSQACNGEAQF